MTDFTRSNARAWRSCLLALLCWLITGSAFAQQLAWQRTVGGQAGGPSVVGTGAVADATGVYLFGQVEGALPGQTAGTSPDPFIRKYGFDGQLLWTRQLEIAPGADTAAALAVDATGLYVAGDAEGIGGFVARLDLNGRAVWSRPLGVAYSARAIVLHASGVYVGGELGGAAPLAFVTKLDRAGNEVWNASLAGSPDHASVQSMGVDDSGIYTSGQLGAADVVKLDLAGHEVARFGSGGSPGYGSVGLALDASGVYVATFEYDLYTAYVIHKYAADGRLLWSRAMTRHQSVLSNLAADASGLYVVGFKYFDPIVPTGTTIVSKFTPSGSELWSYELAGPTSSLIGLSPRDGELLVGSSFFTRLTGCGPYCGISGAYVGKLTQDLPPQLQALSDTDGGNELAVLRHVANTSAVTVVVKDAGTGSAVRRIEFDRNYWPQQLLRVPDSNRNGADDVAVLGTHRTTGRVAAEVRDGKSGVLISRVLFDPGFVPKKLAVLSDLNGNGTPDFALLESRNDAVLDYDRSLTRAEVRDGVTGALIRRIDFPSLNDYFAVALDLAALPDSSGNGAGEVGAFGIRFWSDSFKPFEVRDALSGTSVYDISPSDRLYTSPLYTVLPDATASGAPELVVLSTDRPGNWRAYVYDAGSPPSRRILSFNKTGVPRYLIPVPDLNGNGHPELALLRADPDAGQAIVQIKDSFTDGKIRSFAYPSDGWVNRGIVVTRDLNGNRKPEVAMLQQRKSDDAVRARIHDASTGTFIRSIDF